MEPEPFGTREFSVQPVQLVPPRKRSRIVTLVMLGMTETLLGMGVMLSALVLGINSSAALIMGLLTIATVTFITALKDIGGKEQ